MTMTNFEKWKEARDAWRSAYQARRTAQSVLATAELAQQQSWHRLEVVAKALTPEERLLAVQVEFGEHND